MRVAALKKKHTKTCQTFSVAFSNEQKRMLTPSSPAPPHMVLGTSVSSTRGMKQGPGKKINIQEVSVLHAIVGISMGKAYHIQRLDGENMKDRASGHTSE